MDKVKFNGVLQEIIGQYPNIDIPEFLQQRLQLPSFKAEELAARIEKEYCQKPIRKTQPSFPRSLFEETNKADKSKLTPKSSDYSIECLSEKEFELFTKWLLQELGYEVEKEASTNGAGSDFVVTKNGVKIAVHARKFPKTYTVSNLIMSVAEKTKQFYSCQRSIILATAYFTQQAKEEAQKADIELWDRDTITAKINELNKKAELEAKTCPKYKGSLLQSLLKLEDTNDFIIEPRASGKYDVHLSGVEFPLLTFQALAGNVIRCVFRIKNKQPVAEFDGVALISTDRNNNRSGPDDAHAYALILQYLEEFLK